MIGGALNFGLRAMCNQKTLHFFRSLSPKDPHFYQLPPDDPLFLTNSLSSKDPDTSWSLKDPSFSHLIVKQVTIFGKKFNFSKISTNLTKCWEIFGHFGPESLYFLMHFTERPHIFVCFVTERPPFLTQFVTERLLHLRCLVALVHHFHMWVSPRVRDRYSQLLLCHSSPFSCNKIGCILANLYGLLGKLGIEF